MKEEMVDDDEYDPVSEQLLNEAFLLDQVRQKTGTARFPIGLTIGEVVKMHLLATLEFCDGSRKRTAEMLGISRRTLWAHLNEYGMNSFRK